MTSVRTTNLDRGDAGNVVFRDCSARLSLRSSSSGRGVVDGAWWPRSTDPVIELVALSEALGIRRTPVRRIALTMPGWDSAPRRIRLASGRSVVLDWLRSSGVHLVRILGTDDQPIDLLLIPVDITPATADPVLTDVEVEQTTDLDTGPAAEDWPPLRSRVSRSPGRRSRQRRPALPARRPSSAMRNSLRCYTKPA
ncbi:MAG: DUF5994 family protein, partial [Actinomycetota bacterium]|nr:DUF5994 family protein [Actinomycetota bacterium]